MAFFGMPKNCEWALEHPVLKNKTRDQLNTLIPCTIHADAGPVTKTKSAMCLSWSSMLAYGIEKQTKFLVASWLKDGDADDSEVYRLMLEDFDKLSCDMEANFQFCLLFAKADEQCHCDEWGMTSYNAADETCTECLANRSSRPFTDLSAGAAWRPTERMPTQHYCARVRTPLHALMSSHYFTRWFIVLEVMHVMDCKGVASWVYGGILAILLTLPEMGSNKERRLALINQELVMFQAHHKVEYRLPRLRMSDMTNDGWAELAGPAIKSAMTKAAAPFFEHLSKKYITSGSRRDTSARHVASDLVRFYKIMDDEPTFFSAPALAELSNVCSHFGKHYMWLREFARQSNKLWWPIKPKLHKMQHLPLWAEVINPRHVHCYGEESSIGTTTLVWKRSIVGKYKNFIQRNVLVKRIGGLFLRFEQEPK